jgi:hypothetical protein
MVLLSLDAGSFSCGGLARSHTIKGCVCRLGLELLDNRRVLTAKERKISHIRQFTCKVFTVQLGVTISCKVSKKKTERARVSE